MSNGLLPVFDVLATRYYAALQEGIVSVRWRGEELDTASNKHCMLSLKVAIVRVSTRRWSLDFRNGRPVEGEQGWRADANNQRRNTSELDLTSNLCWEASCQ